MLIDGRFYFVFAYFIYAILIITLILVLFFGVEVNASRSWIQMGSIRIQPAEFAKFATALALAKLMSSYGFKLNNVSSYIRIALIIMMPMVMILLQNDTGSALVYSTFIWVLYREGLPTWIMGLFGFLILVFILSLIFNKFIILIGLFCLTMLLFVIIVRRYRDAVRFTILVLGLSLVFYGASEFFDLKISPYYLILIPIGIGIPLALINSYLQKIKIIPFLIFLFITTATFNFSVDYIFNKMLEQHHRDRINDLLGIESDPLGWGYNVNQSKIAIGSGGFWGKGYLQGT